MIWETAGVLGIDPRPHTFHELVTMRTGYEREQWDRLAYQLTTIARIAGSKTAKLQDFHKFMGNSRGLTKDNLKAKMKAQFGGKVEVVKGTKSG